MHEFNKEDLKDVEKYIQRKLVWNYIQHFFLMALSVFTVAVIANQYISGMWQQILVTIGVSVYPAMNCYQHMIQKQVEINRVYSYMKGHSSSIIDLLNKVNNQGVDEDESDTD